MGEWNELFAYAAYRAGKRAASEGVPLEENPLARGPLSPFFMRWRSGWSDQNEYISRVAMRALRRARRAPSIPDAIENATAMEA